MKAKEFLSKVSGEYYDICTKYFWEYINNKSLKYDEREQNLKQLLIWDYYSDKTLIVENYYSKNEYKALIEKTREIIEQLVENLVKKQVSEQMFYNEIWSVISRESLFADDEDKLSAVLNLFDSKYTPYFELESINEIDDKNYNLKMELLPVMRKFFFINNIKIPQMEKASHWYNLIKSLKTDEERIVLLSLTMDYYDFKFKSIVDELKRVENDDN